MTAINRMTGEVVHYHDIVDWTMHYDKLKDLTYVMLGDEVLLEIAGNTDFDECEDLLSDEWDIQPDDESDVIRARINRDSICEYSDAYCVEIYQPSTDEIKYECYKSFDDAEKRVLEINSVNTIDWKEI
jgi:hypothetical protein